SASATAIAANADPLVFRTCSVCGADPVNVIVSGFSDVSSENPPNASPPAPAGAAAPVAIDVPVPLPVLVAVGAPAFTFRYARPHAWIVCPDADGVTVTVYVPDGWTLLARKMKNPSVEFGLATSWVNVRDGDPLSTTELID